MTREEIKAAYLKDSRESLFEHDEGFEITPEAKQLMRRLRECMKSK